MFNLTLAFETPRWIEIVSALWIMLTFILGIALNGLTIGVFLKNRKMINEKMFFNIAIFVNGFITSCFGFVPVIIAEFSGHWFVHMSEASCVYEAFVNYYFGTSSMFYHVCITIRRYLGIVALPLNNAPIEKWRVALAFAGCQLLSLVLAVSPLLGFGSYGLEAHGTSCGLALNDRSSTGKAYLIGIGTVCYVLPVTITSIVYVLIIKTIRVQQSTVRVMLASSKHAKKRKQEEVHLVITSLGLVLAFVVSWTPYVIVSFYTVFGNPDTINPIISRTPALLAKTVVVWNPIIYALLSKSFRQKAVQLVRCGDASYVATRPQKATELGCATAESDCTIRPTRAINENIL